VLYWIRSTPRDGLVESTLSIAGLEKVRIRERRSFRLHKFGECVLLDLCCSEDVTDAIAAS